ncbi:MAG: hypothetical protein ACFFDB_03865 [Promethearchaeota archaeon]
MSEKNKCREKSEIFEMAVKEWRLKERSESPKEKKDFIKCKFCGYIVANPFPKNKLCPKCRKFIPELIGLLNFELLRCENCKKPLRFDPFEEYPEGYPKIDGETFQLCPKCFKILKDVVQDIEDIFDDE